MAPMSSFRRHPLGSVFAEMPPAVLTILVGCIVLWFVEASTMAWWRSFWEPWLALTADGLLHGRVWQLVTYQFLHEPRTPWHVVFNMLVLFTFGRRLEGRWGTAGFVRFYLACGIGGGVLYALLALMVGSGEGVVGASGALFGLLLAYALIWPRDQILVMFVVPMEVRHFVLILFLLDLMSTWLGWLGNNPVGAAAHVGGALTGWAYLAHAGKVQRMAGWRPSPLQSIRKWWRRRRVRVADTDFEQWLKKHDDETRH